MTKMVKFGLALLFVAATFGFVSCEKKETTTTGATTEMGSTVETDQTASVSIDTLIADLTACIEKVEKAVSENDLIALANLGTEYADISAKITELDPTTITAEATEKLQKLAERYNNAVASLSAAQ